jgi:hypothetical protein
MATNNNGHLLDSAGNVAVDFVWGNFPLQPNDVRTNLLSPTLDNHAIATTGWNGYPQYLPGNPGEQLAGVAYLLVTAVVGLTTALAVDALTDAGYAAADITTAAGASNSSISYTVVTRTAGSFDATVTATGAVAAYPVGAKITTTGTVAGTFTVKSVSSTNLVTFTTTASTVLTSGSGTLVGVAGTIKTQSVAPGADSIARGTAITITPYAA